MDVHRGGVGGAAGRDRAEIARLAPVCALSTRGVPDCEARGLNRALVTRRAAPDETGSPGPVERVASAFESGAVGIQGAREVTQLIEAASSIAAGQLRLREHNIC